MIIISSSYHECIRKAETMIRIAFICTLIVNTWCLSLGKESSRSDSTKKIFIYDWPDLVDRYANTTDRPHHSHGVDIPHWRSNFGAGRIIRRNISEYRTSQFSLFKLLYERALIDSRRTTDPSTAGSFLIPYDFGMDAIFTESNGRMRKTYCPLANEVVSRLKSSPNFLANGGHDHTLIVSVNQHMNYFFNAKACTELLLLCWNCTKLSVDEYLFVAKDRALEMKQRGINWHAVPFPSDYHYDSRVFGTATSPSSSETVSAQREKALSPPWEWIAENRSRLISYLGNPRKLSPYSSSLREALVVQCMNHSDVCTHGLYNHEAHESPNYDSRRSVFCLQPPGDMPTRKSVFDVILSGCIPVLFHPLTATYMYEWHWSPEVWDQVGVHFDSFDDTQQLLGQQTDFIKKLVDMNSGKRELIQKKRQAIREQAFKLQYSLIFRDPASHRAVVSRQYEGVGLDRKVRQDAYDISMGAILDIHYGRRSHDRVAPFVTCKQIPGAGGRTMLQTFEGCNVTAGAVQDPFYPPAVASVFLGGRKRGHANAGL